MRKKRVYKVAFWNVVDLKNKDREFWRGLGDWDVLSETWGDKKGREQVRQKMPKEYVWEVQ